MENGNFKLSGCINPTDGHANDVVYHKECFVKNVSNVIRKSDKTEILPNFAESACQIEFIDCLLEELLSGKGVTMTDAEKCYREICHSKCVKEIDMISRKSLKALIESELFHLDLVFTNPESKKEPQRIMFKSVSDALIMHSEETCNLNNNLKLFIRLLKF